MEHQATTLLRFTCSKWTGKPLLRRAPFLLNIPINPGSNINYLTCLVEVVQSEFSKITHFHALFLAINLDPEDGRVYVLKFIFGESLITLYFYNHRLNNISHKRLKILSALVEDLRAFKLNLNLFTCWPLWRDFLYISRPETITQSCSNLHSAVLM